MSLTGLSGMSALSGIVAPPSSVAVGIPTTDLYAHWTASFGVTETANAVTEWDAETEFGTDTTLADIGSNDPLYSNTDATLNNLPSIMTETQRYFFVNQEFNLNTASGFVSCVWYGTDNTDAGAFLTFARATFASSYYYRWATTNTGLIERVRFINPVANTITQPGGSPWANSTAYVWTFADTGSRVIVRRNGSEVLNATTAVAYLDGVDTAGSGLRIQVGSDIGGTSSPITWGDLAIYKSYNTTLVGNVESFLANKYGIALA